MAMANVQMACQALLNSELFAFGDAASESARAMTAAALPHACGEHSYQKEVLALASSILQSAQEAGTAEAQRLGEEATAAQAGISEAEEAVEAAEKATLEAKAHAQAQAAALRQQKFKVKQAVGDDKFAAGEHRRALASRDEAASQKCAADSALAMLEAFEAGQLEDLPVDGLLKILTSANAEKCLMDAVPVLLTVPKEKRGEFDAIGLAELKEVLAEYITSLANSLAEAEKIFKDIWAEALGCEALREVEEERQAAAEQALQDAEKATEARAAEEDAARAVVKEREAARSSLLVHQVLAQEKTATASNALAAVESLRNPAPPADEAQDVEMTPAEAAIEEPKKVGDEAQADGMGEVLMRVARPAVA